MPETKIVTAVAHSQAGESGLNCRSNYGIPAVLVTGWTLHEPAMRVNENLKPRGGTVAAGGYVNVRPK